MIVHSLYLLSEHHCQDHKLAQHDEVEFTVQNVSILYCIIITVCMYYQEDTIYMYMYVISFDVNYMYKWVVCCYLDPWT